MSLATSLAVKPLSPALGAEVVGLDLRQELALAHGAAEVDGEGLHAAGDLGRDGGALVDGEGPPLGGVVVLGQVVGSTQHRCLGALGA